jgi:hypothetical protein
MSRTMSTKWVITSAADKIVLDDQRAGEIAFTVSNPSQRADRAVLEVVPGEGADPSWFATNDPQRMVPANGSVAYLVKVAVPAGVIPGQRSVQGRVYSSDVAPEEGSVLSGRILFDVAGAAAPAPKRRPWWILAVAALVLIVVGVVVWLLVPSGNAAPVAAPSHSAAPSRAASPSAKPSTSPTPATATVPNVQGLSEADAVKQLTAVGLVEGKVQHRQNPAQAGKVLSQSATLTTVPLGTKVDVVVGVSLAAPTITAPGGGQGFGQGSSVDVRWTQAETWVTTWHVSTVKENCYYYFAHSYNNCHWDGQADTTVGIKLYTASFSLSYQPLLNLGNYNTGHVQAAVAAVDDFGTVGPIATVQFSIS